MTEIKRGLDFISKEKREKIIREIITYFENENDLELGMIAAEDILDFFLRITGDEIYNKGIEDSKKEIKKCFENLEIDLDLLLKK